MIGMKEIFVLLSLIGSMVVFPSRSDDNASSNRQSNDFQRWQFKYCGKAVAELAAWRIAERALTGEQYQRLAQQQSSSMTDVRLTLEENGFQVRSFSVSQHDFVGLMWVERLVRFQYGQVIVLVPAQQGTESEIGHFCVVDWLGKDEAILIEPCTGSEIKMSFSALADSDGRILLQHVLEPSQRHLAAPISLQKVCWLTILPLVALSIFVSQRKKTSKT